MRRGGVNELIFRICLYLAQTIRHMLELKKLIHSQLNGIILDTLFKKKIN